MTAADAGMRQHRGPAVEAELASNAQLRIPQGEAHQVVVAEAVTAEARMGLARTLAGHPVAGHGGAAQLLGPAAQLVDVERCR